jgi:hypothetical protein
MTTIKEIESMQQKVDELKEQLAASKTAQQKQLEEDIKALSAKVDDGVRECVAPGTVFVGEIYRLSYAVSPMLAVTDELRAKRPDIATALSCGAIDLLQLPAGNLPKLADRCRLDKTDIEQVRDLMSVSGRYTVRITKKKIGGE